MNLKPIAIGAAVGIGAFALCATARDRMTRRMFNLKYEAFKCDGSDNFREGFANSTSAFMFGGPSPSTGRATGAILIYNANDVDELVHILDNSDLSEAPVEEITRICQAFVLATMNA